MKLNTRLTALFIVVVSASQLYGQALRFSNRREVAIPDYAVIRIGPFYSSATFSQSLGYRWTRSSGTGTDFLVANRRGAIREDGSEFPIISTLSLRNYLLITRNTDLDASIRISYEYYPLDTQEDEFNIDLVEEGIYGTLSMEYRLTPYVKGTLFDHFTYRTDFVDTRGLTDTYGGQRYEYINNRFGTRLDWLLASDKNVGLNLSRTDRIPQSDGFENQESTAYNEALVYEYRLFPRFVIGASAGATQTDYEVEERPDTSLYNYSIFGRYNYGETGEEGVRVRLTDLSTLSFGLGYSAGVGAERAFTGTGTETVTTQQVTAAESDIATATGHIKLRTQLRRNLAHSLGYARTVKGGFKTAFETVDKYEYRLTWDGYATKASAFSTLSIVEPSDINIREYDNWTSGVTVEYPLIRYVALHFLSSYAIRANTGTVINEENLPVEERFDHRTWTTRLGTSFDLTKKIKFDAYAMRVRRTSESDDLEYIRDIVAATLKYTHQF